ncbi:hypothetical protein L1987_65134 [Smallanthus sonchifolius]|uniref:Uncharacterized protein n=1 Tax=Smallanthus sonchifolius TaxID=185202 RepID=A0ACB9BTU1_9ASTR|nr:hypothetical protein L1987_65134 [Smallanthus sonchifolius]
MSLEYSNFSSHNFNFELDVRIRSNNLIQKSLIQKIRLEESTGLAFRFVIGKIRDKSKMAELKKEVEEYDDFLLLDIEEEYSKLPYRNGR